LNVHCNVHIVTKRERDGHRDFSPSSYIATSIRLRLYLYSFSLFVIILCLVEPIFTRNLRFRHRGAFRFDGQYPNTGTKHYKCMATTN